VDEGVLGASAEDGSRVEFDDVVPAGSVVDVTADRDVFEFEGTMSMLEGIVDLLLLDGKTGKLLLVGKDSEDKGREYMVK
jgi:hypothetical protein